MCGRYAFDDMDEIYEVRALLQEIASKIGSGAAARVKTGEVFPTDAAAVLTRTESGIGPKVMCWGYPLTGTKRSVINARSESMSERPLFRKSKKCLIPCTGFYEWEKHENGKTKYLITTLASRFFYLAGLYDSFTSKGVTTDRFVIVTAPACEHMQKIHCRMPLIVPKGKTEAWLGEYADNAKRIQNISAMTGALNLKAV